MKRIWVSVCLLATVLSASGRAQQPATAMKLTTYKVEVTMTRLAGDKVLGVSPYALLVNSTPASGGNRASLRIGIEVPSGTVTSQGSGRSETAFKTVGTQIDCSVAQFDDTRYTVELSINDTAIFSGGDDDRMAQAQKLLDLATQKHARQKELFSRNLVTRANLNEAELSVKVAQMELDAIERAAKSIGRADQMAFRSFTSSNRVYLRDGESQEMTVATDRTSGETIKAAVKLTVVK